MRQWLLEELRCPVCRSNLHLESAVPIKYQVDNSGEIEEGLIQCESCHAQYPIICGVAILLADVATYIGQNFTKITSLGVQYGISREMLNYISAQGLDFAQQDTLISHWWESTYAIQIYIAAHYDDLSDILPTQHLFRPFLDAYKNNDFYSVVINMLQACTSKIERTLDVGYNVGGMSSRLSKISAKVYGIDLIFESILTARRILLGSPSPLQSYRLPKIGNLFEERYLNIDLLKDNQAEFMVASVYDIPFPLDFFDLVNCANVIDTVHNPRGMIEAIRKILISQGFFINTDPYDWGLNTSPLREWIGGSSGVNPEDAIREYLEDFCEMNVLAEEDVVTWVLRVHDRCFHVWFNHCILSQTVGVT